MLPVVPELVPPGSNPRGRPPVARRRVGPESSRRPTPPRSLSRPGGLLWALLLAAGLLPTTLAQAQLGTNSFLWRTNFPSAPGVSYKSSAEGVAVDGDGNRFIVGQSSAAWTSFGSVTFTNLNPLIPGRSDAFVAKVDADGSVLWARQLGGEGYDTCGRVGVDALGNCYILGSFESVARFGNTTLTSDGAMDLFLAKYNPVGTLQWVRQVGGAGVQVAGGIAVDPAGSCYVTGSSDGGVRLGVTQLPGSPGRAAFVARYSSGGILQWTAMTSVADVTNGVTSRGIAIDGQGNSFITGSFRGPAIFGSIPLEAVGPDSADLFLAKLSPSGAFLWARAGGGLGEDSGNAVVVDPSGYCLVAGSTAGGAFGGFAATVVAGQDALLAKYSADGSPLWVRTLGGTNIDTATALAVDASGNAFLAGTFQGWFRTLGGPQVLGSGPTDSFLARFDPSGAFSWGIASGSTPPLVVRGLALASSNRLAEVGHQLLGDGYLLNRRSSVPVIVTHPQPVITLFGTAATFSVVMADPAGISFQWLKEGVPIPGATNSVLALASTTAGDVGTYAVRVSDAEISFVSGSATLALQVKISTQQSGNGTIVAPLNGTVVPLGATVRANAVPTLGNAFVRWEGDFNSVTNPVNIVVQSNLTLRAVFLPSAPLTVNINGSGRVDKLPNKTTYYAGEPVTLTAVPSRWYQFGGWENATTKNPRTLLAGSLPVTAYFAPVTLLETVTDGVTTREAPFGMPALYVNGIFTTNSHVAVTGGATLSFKTSFAGGVITYTLDGTEPSVLSRVYLHPFVLSAKTVVRAKAWNAVLTVGWEMDPLTLAFLPAVPSDGLLPVSVAGVGGGRVALLPAPPAGRFPSNSVVKLTAVPDPNMSFVGWRGDAVGGTTSILVTVTHPISVEAVFGTSLRTAVSLGQGRVLRDPDLPVYPVGTRVRLTAVPDAGNTFALWTGSAAGNINPTEVIMPQVSALAVFAPLPAGEYAFTLDSVGQGRAESFQRGTRFPAGTRMTVTAFPEPGQEFLGWTGDLASMENPLSFPLDRSLYLAAQFSRRPRLTASSLPWSLGPARSGIRLRVAGEIGSFYQVLRSTDPGVWVSIGSATNYIGEAQLDDLTAPPVPAGLYRTLLQAP